MANKIFRDMLNPQKKLVRNGFDRSYLNNFTAKIGELLPVMCVETVPGSHYEIKVADFMRTIPMRQAAFIRSNQHFDFYFVPYKQLWRYFDDFYTQRSVPTSSLNGSTSSPSAAPNAQLAAIYAQIASSRDEEAVTVKNVGDIGENIAYGCEKMVNMLGYGSCKAYDVTDSDTRTMLASKSPNLFRAAAYQKICFDYYRQPFYDLPYTNIAYNFNLDDANFETGVVSANYNVTEFNVQHYRYARMFQMHYRQWKKDLFTGVLPNTQFGAISVVSTGSGSAVQQAVELAVSGSTGLISSVGESARVWAQGANDDSSGYFIASDIMSPDVQQNYGVFNVPILEEESPDPSHAGVIANQYSNSRPQIGVMSNGTTVTGTASGNVTIPASSGSFNILDLVKAQAVQKWRETTMRAGFRNVDQYDAHFGVKPIFTEKDRCVFIDSVTSPLEVNSVLNTNAGASVGDTQVPLGEMGANAMSAINSNKTIQFDAKDFGVIMCIYSMLPEATYEGIGLDFMNAKILRDDYFTPEYENVGMVPVSMDNFRLQALPSVNGFAARYYEYKVNIDRQTDEFNAYNGHVGAFATWSPARQIDTPQDQSGVSAPRLFARDLYVNPRYYRNIFSRLPYLTDDDDPYMPQKTIGDSAHDSFMHQCYFDIKCVQPMSVLGLPNY